MGVAYMSDYHLTKRWGEAITNPTIDDLSSALNQLNQSDPEHPDCWVSDALGWTISVSENGKVIFENLETGEGPWHMRDVSREESRDLWLLLISDDLSSIRSKPWTPGYGNR
jgi:hypothetical protein